MLNPIDTPRLTLDRLCSDDVLPLLDYRNDREVARYQSWECMSIDEAAELVHSQAELAPGTPGRWFQFAVRLKPHRNLIGDCGLFVDADDPRLGEIGFTFSPAHQGHGLAYEAASAVLSFAFDVLHLHRVKAIVDCRNRSAVRLLERLGLRREAHFRQHSWFKGAWCDEYVYAVLASDWQDAQCQQPRRDA